MYLEIFYNLILYVIGFLCLLLRTLKCQFNGSLDCFDSVILKPKLINWIHFVYCAVIEIMYYV